MLGLLPIIGVAVVLVLVGQLLISTVNFVINSRKHLKKILQLPGTEPKNTFWGHSHEFPGPGPDGLKYFIDRTKDTDLPLSKLQLGPLIGAVTLYRPDSVKTLLKTSEPKARGFGAYKFLMPWLGDGLLNANGQKWARNRRLLTPAFHYDILKPYVVINNQCAEIFMDKLPKLHESKEFIEVFEHVSLLTFDIILKCAFSYDIDCQNVGYQHPYILAVKELAEAIMYRVTRPHFYPDWIYYFTPSGRNFRKNCHLVHKVSEQVIKERKKALEQYGNSIMRHHKYIDFLDILLKAKDSDDKGLSDSEIRDEVDTFLFEGHDTTASGISWTLYSLAQHPDIQAKCQKEVDELLENRESENIEWDDLNKLTYLTMCIKESLRLHTPVPIIQRENTKEMTVEGYKIPANTIIEVNIYTLHHNRFVWDEPFEYRPERFSPENLEKMDPYQFVPFSAGPRNCIGQSFAMHEMKVVIARILKRYTLEIDPTRVALHTIAAVMKTESGMFLKFVPRK